MNESIFVTCEGSWSESQGYCPMCALPCPSGDLIPPHQRLDIIAMIDRGDFD